MTDRAALVVHRALVALHLGDSAQFARQLHADVVYDVGQELVSGRDAVAATIVTPPLEHLRAEIVPGRVEDRGDHFIAELETILRWRSSGETADVNPQALAIHMRDGLIARVEQLTPRAQSEA